MSFNERTVAEIVRHRLGYPDGSRNARIIFQIPAALEQLARKVAANPRKRPMLLTRPDDLQIDLELGAVDVEAYNQLGSDKLLVEYIHVGQMFYESSIQREFNAQSIATGDLFYTTAPHNLVPGQAVRFVTPAALPGPGPTWLNDVNYFVIIPTQAALDATGFIGATTTPEYYFQLAIDRPTALAGSPAINVSLNQPALELTTLDGSLDAQPMKKVDASEVPNIESHPFYGDYRFYFLDGPAIRVVDPASEHFALGQLRMRVPYQPTLAQIEDLPELHNDFLDKLVELCTAADAAEDGEH